MAPVKKLTQKEIGLKMSPWITHGILQSMNYRDYLYKQFTSENDQDTKAALKLSYNRFRNRVISLIRISKKQYFSNYFEEHNTNIKKTWEAIRYWVPIWVPIRDTNLSTNLGTN